MAPEPSAQLDSTQVDSTSLDSTLTAEHEALKTQATPAVAIEDSSPGRWRVPASARGRRPTRSGEDDSDSVDSPANGEASPADGS